MVYVKEVTGTHAPIRIFSESNFEEILHGFCFGRAYTRREVFEEVLTPRFRELFNAHKDLAQQMRDSLELCMVNLAMQFDAESASEAAMNAVDGLLNSLKS